MNRIPFLTIILSLIFCFNSCEKSDDKDVPPRNEIVFGGNNYELPSGRITSYSNVEVGDGVGYDTEISLETEGYEFEVNKGSTFEITLHSATSSFEGEYFVTDSYPLEFGEAWCTFQLTQWDEVSDGIFYDCVGSLSISKNGTKYKISFSGTSEDDIVCEVFYEGSLRYFD